MLLLENIFVSESTKNGIVEQAKAAIYKTVYIYIQSD